MNGLQPVLTLCWDVLLGMGGAKGTRQINDVMGIIGPPPAWL